MVTGLSMSRKKFPLGEVFSYDNARCSIVFIVKGHRKDGAVVFQLLEHKGNSHNMFPYPIEVASQIVFDMGSRIHRNAIPFPSYLIKKEIKEILND